MTLYYILIAALALLAVAAGVLSLIVTVRDSKRIHRTMTNIDRWIARH